MLMASNAASPRNVFGVIKGCFWKKSIKTGRSAFESARIYPHPENPISFLQRYLDGI